MSKICLSRSSTIPRRWVRSAPAVRSWLSTASRCPSTRVRTSGGRMLLITFLRRAVSQQRVDGGTEFVPILTELSQMFPTLRGQPVIPPRRPARRRGLPHGHQFFVGQSRQDRVQGRFGRG